jgi:hypothetical protein
VSWSPEDGEWRGKVGVESGYIGVEGTLAKRGSTICVYSAVPRGCTVIPSFHPAETSLLMNKEIMKIIQI